MLDKKKDELKDLIESAGEQIKNHVQSEEDIKELFNFQKNFHVYSLRNQALIDNQFKGAYAVGSFNFWKSRGFSPKKGEKGIKIITPITINVFTDENGERKKVSEATSEEKMKIKNGEIKTQQINSYIKGYVWDISQTTATESDLPKLFPNRWTDKKVDDYQTFYKGLEKVAEKFKIKIIDPPYELGVVKGASFPTERAVTLNPRNGELQNIKTLIHELAHAKLHTLKTRNNYTKAEKEFQAELVSYAICSNYGLDTAEYALPYLKAWVQDSDIPKRTKLLAEVYDTCTEYIKVLDQHFVESKQELTQTHQQEQQQVEELDKQSLKQESKLEVDQQLENNPILNVTESNQELNKFAQERMLSVSTLENVGVEVKDQWLTFPVHNEQGELVGVASRRKDDDEDNKHLPKWKLSPNFPKQDVLYNYNESKHAIAQTKQAIIVEGIFDALAFKEVGLNQVVGLMGASMSAEQLARLKKAEPKQYIIATDHDIAGFNAGLKIEKQIKDVDPNANVFFFNLGHHKDPNDLLKAVGVDGFKQWISSTNQFTKTKLSHILTQKELSERHRGSDPLSVYGQAMSQFLSQHQRQYQKEPCQQQSAQNRKSVISLKRDLDIIDVCEQLLGMSLQKAGRGEYTANCPTLDHHEKTPSFFVSEVKQCFKCFGCGAGGDVIQLAKQSLTNSQGDPLTFKETLEVLHKYRQSLPPEIIKRNQQRYDERSQAFKQKCQQKSQKL